MATRAASLIGVGEFDSPDFGALPFVGNDIAKMKEVLIDERFGNFETDQVKTLLHPTEEKMKNAIYDFFQRRHCERGDLRRLYFSGHGALARSGKFFFIGRNSRKDDEFLRETSALRADFVQERIDECPAKQIAIILDCCFSGMFGKWRKGKHEGGQAIQQQLGGEGRAILTASRDLDFAFPMENLSISAYTHFLLEGVTTGKANQNNDEYLSL